MWQEASWQDIPAKSPYPHTPQERSNMKERLDILLVNKNLAPSREKAKALIMSGIVYVDGQKEDLPGKF